MLLKARFARQVYWNQTNEALDLQNEVASRTYATVVHEVTGLPPRSNLDLRPLGERPANALAQQAAARDSAAAIVAALRSSPPATGSVPVTLCDSCALSSATTAFLQSRGLDVSGGRAGGMRPNALVFESQVPIERVREVALALMVNETALKRIRLAFHDAPTTAPPMIRLVYDQRLNEWPPLSVAQIHAMCVRTSASTVCP
jgi:hypothetical protein